MRQRFSPREIRFRPIGVIRSPYTVPEETPIQPVFAAGTPGRVELLEEYSGGLQDLEGFSHIFLFYVFDRAPAPRLMVRPFLDRKERGVFSTRAPCRPNPLGFSLVRLDRREGPLLHVLDIDVLDGTPLLDIKPFSTRFDAREKTRSGWLETVDEPPPRAFGRKGPSRGTPTKRD